MAATAPYKWIEIFHSKPSMAHCYLLEKGADGKFTAPSRQNELQDASHIRDGFRVMRLIARRIEFVLTNGTNRAWEDNGGQNYIVSEPGRYVVEHGIRRVGDANDEECFQSVLRSQDCYIQLQFRADLWEQCCCNYQKDGGEWTDPPGVAMELKKSDTEGRFYELEVQAKRIMCAFNDGGEIWDSNLGKNYRVGCPGKYSVTDGQVKYICAADKDAKKSVRKITEIA